MGKQAVKSYFGPSWETSSYLVVVGHSTCLEGGVFDCSVTFLQKNEAIHEDDMPFRSFRYFFYRFPLGKADGEQIQGFGPTCTIPLLATFGQLMRRRWIPHIGWTMQW